MGTESALVLEATIPLRFVAFSDGERPKSRALDNNLKVFQACDILDERPSADRVDLDLPVALELKRLDLKMSLMLELMMDLLRQGDRTATEVQVELDFRGVAWTPANGDLSVGQRGIVELFVHEGLPRPLKFTGSIVAMDAVRSRVRFEFDGLDETESDQLERLIFKRHRRKVADIRGLKRSV